MDFWQRLNGFLQIELISASMEHTLHILAEENVELYHIRMKNELTIHCIILRRDINRIIQICERKGDRVRILEKKGIYWKWKELFSRPLFLIGTIVLITASLVIPRFIFFVKVEGNQQIPANLILESAENCGIRFGATRRFVRSERVKNELLSSVSGLQWAAVNTKGCLAVVLVQEKKSQERKEGIYPAVSSIVACKDGVITEFTVDQGDPQCRNGQAVRKGEVLISAYTDCGNRIQVSNAKGEVYAQTQWDTTTIIPAKWFRKKEITHTKRSINLLLGKKRINLWKDSGISHGSCGRMYEEYYIILPGEFVLPIGIGIETYQYGTIAACCIPDTEAVTIAPGFTQEYILSQMIAGSVLSQQYSWVAQKDVYMFSGCYLCQEMIGREIPEKIGELYE